MTRRKLLCFVVFISIQVICYGDETRLAAFLENYFETENYRYEKHIISKQELIFAYRIIDGERDIFDKAIIFSYQNTSIVLPQLFVTKNKVIDRNSKIIFEGIIANQLFYGWTLKVVEQNNSFSTNYFTDNGIHVTDGPIFIWDNKSNCFIQFAIDRNM